MNKFVVSGVAIVLVVGVVIGIIASVSHTGSSSKDDNVSTTSKSVSAICSPTDYKDACIKSLSSYANNQSATPKDFIQTALQVTIQEVKAALQKSGVIGNGTNNSTQKMAADDCKDLLQFAIDELQASFSTVGDSELHTISDREDELKNWLSAVISYQETCIDGFTQPDLKNEMSNGLLNASQLTSNALAIVSALSEILTSFNIPINTTASSRRLLDASGVDDNEYPEWLSAKDRKLLQSNSGGQVKPNAIVAKDGSGQFKTITAALDAYPKASTGRYVIYVKAGIYDEYIIVTKNQVNVFMYGDGPQKTIITGKKSFREGVSTYQTASFAAIGAGFIAKSMGFQNTAGPEGHQAVALRVQSDTAAFYDCRMDGYQDTLYVQTHRQFYSNCVVSGTVDFIFGDSSTVIQNSKIIVRKPMDNQQNTITAQGRKDKREITGLVLQNCNIVPEESLYPLRLQIRSYLGRPWKEFSRTVIMESTIGDLIQPAGWLEWAGNFALDTLFYAEYANQGPGAKTAGRVKWKGYKVITDRNEALQFTVSPFIQGNQWLGNSTVPYYLGFKGTQAS
ncbi:hypothetical protein SO802_026956 [Lithocarpus litseifolius]|uniref:Pectinesterase n=1 Tax=Lithocarpus litseifolius TaxID=425828 RepID=A0AAW2C1B2_9ROSI